VTNTSVNPARSTGPAFVVGGIALQQLWLFWVAPIVGAVGAGLVHRWMSAEEVLDRADTAAAARSAASLAETAAAARSAGIPASGEALAPMPAREPR
jgi:aquaporin Z